MALTDIELFSQVKKGNQLAFQNLFRNYYKPIARFINSFVRDGEVAEEVAQELFIYFWEYAPRMEISTSFKAYIYTSARNFALNYLKKAAIRQKYHQQANVIEENINEASALNNDLFNKLANKAMDTLPEKCRQILVLSKYDGLTYDEIAEYLNISKKTIENQMTIGLRKLREELQPYMSRVFE